MGESINTDFGSINDFYNAVIGFYNQVELCKKQTETVLDQLEMDLLFVDSELDEDKQSDMDFMFADDDNDDNKQSDLDLMFADDDINKKKQADLNEQVKRVVAACMECREVLSHNSADDLRQAVIEAVTEMRTMLDAYKNV